VGWGGFIGVWEGDFAYVEVAAAAWRGGLWVPA
jgi:hypothetical protein